MVRTLAAFLLLLAGVAGCGGSNTGPGALPAEGSAAHATAVKAELPRLPASAVNGAAACAATTMAACRLQLRAQSTAPLLSLEPSAAFQWAERALPELFGPASVPGAPPVSDGPYLYRYYFNTWNYLGFAGRSVYVLGPASGGQLLQVGTIDDYACRIAPVACSAAASPVLADLDGRSFPAMSAIAVRPPDAGAPGQVSLLLAGGTELRLQPGADGRYVLPMVVDRTQALLTVQDGDRVLYRATFHIEPVVNGIPAGSAVRGYLRASIQVAQEALSLVPTSDSAGRARLQERLASMREALALVSDVIEQGSVTLGPGLTPVTITDLRLQDAVLLHALQHAVPVTTRLASMARNLSAEDQVFADAVTALSTTEYANNVAQAWFSGMGAVGTAAVVGGVLLAAPAAVTFGTMVGAVAVGASIVGNLLAVSHKTLYGDVSGFSRKDEIVGVLSSLTSAVGFKLSGVSAGIEAEARRLVLAAHGAQYPLLSTALNEVTQLGWSEAIAAGFQGVADLVTATPPPAPGAVSPLDPTPERGCRLQADGSGSVYVSGPADAVWHTIVHLPLGPRPLLYFAEGDYWYIGNANPGDNLGCQSRWSYLEMYCVMPDGTEASAPRGLWGYSQKCSAPAVGYRARGQVPAACVAPGVKVETLSNSDDGTKLRSVSQDFTCR